MRYFLFVSLLLSVLTISCNQNTTVAGTTDSEEGFAAFNKDSLGNDISILSSDSFIGRKPFTEGEAKAITYLQKRFAEVGLEPGNGNSYLQAVPMVNIATKADSFLQVQSPKGKIVMVMVNDPGYGIDSGLFKGDTMTYYGRWTYKFEEAARQGAKGCLVIHNTNAASYPFSVVQNNWNGSRLHLDDRGENVPYCDVVGWVSEPTAKKLLSRGGYDSTLLAKAAQPGFKPVPLNLKLTT